MPYKFKKDHRNHMRLYMLDYRLDGRDAGCRKREREKARARRRCEKHPERKPCIRHREIREMRKIEMHEKRATLG